MVALVMALLLLPGVSHALKDEQEALIGLNGVYVLIEHLNSQAESLGLTTDQIKTDVELRLRKAGIRVLTKEESLATPGSPYLYVYVGTYIKEKNPIIAFSNSVELKESVTLANGFKTTGSIWSAASIGLFTKENIKQIRGSVGERVDEFINDFLAANPK